MDLQKTTAFIAKHEGLRLGAYTDTKGIWTLGIGFNVERQGAQGALRAHGIDADAVQAAIDAAKAQGAHRTDAALITEDQAYALAADDIQAAITDLQSFVTGFDAMPDDPQMVLVDLYYNLGGHGLRAFHHTLACFVAGNWAGAAANLEASHPWCDQVPVRCADDCAVLRAV